MILVGRDITELTRFAKTNFGQSANTMVLVVLPKLDTDFFKTQRAMLFSPCIWAAVLDGCMAFTDRLFTMFACRTWVKRRYDCAREYGYKFYHIPLLH